MIRFRDARLAILFVLLLPSWTVMTLGVVRAEQQISALIIEGQLGNHPWRGTTPLIQATLENTGRFQVQTFTFPPHEEIPSSPLRPDFSAHDVVIFNYKAPTWPDALKNSLETYVRSGGGLVIVHSASNAFPHWPEYNQMIGLGGWGGRSETEGVTFRWRDGQMVRDATPGVAGTHGRRHEFLIDNRNSKHPIMRGLPTQWLHSSDELYEQMRGPAESMTVLATAFADPNTGGSGENEPMLWTVDYHQGRVFHSVLGHDLVPLLDVGYQSTLARGTEWAATGKVTLPVPASFPTAQRTATRNPMLNDKANQLGWQSLFNGRDLDGWKQVNGTASYRIDKREVAIVGTTSEGSPNSFLSTKNEYADFELRFEVKLLNKELNSGVQIRSHQYAEDDPDRGKFPIGRVYGYQVEIEAAQDENSPAKKFGDAGFIYDEARRGWLHSERQQLPAARAAFKNGQWNHYRVLAVGDHLQTWVNGVLCADVHDTEDATGNIMLQVHRIAQGSGPYSVAWRNILLKEIHANPR